MVKYIGFYEKVKIICKKHGIFKQSPSDHIRGIGCPICANNTQKTRKVFIKESNLIHDNKYDYSLVEYKNNKTKVKIICPIHGLFKQRPNDHLNNHGCFMCNDSKGEKQIRKKLKEYNIIFESQKRFKGCKYKKTLPFDFYLPTYNMCIEFDGEQHYIPFECWGGYEYLKTQKIKDRIKDSFCEENKIKLLRIKFSDKINEKILEIL